MFSAQLLTSAVAMPLRRSIVKNGTVSSYSREFCANSCWSRRTTARTSAGSGSPPDALMTRAEASVSERRPSVTAAASFRAASLHWSAGTPASAASSVAWAAKSQLRIVSYTSMRHADTAGTNARYVGAPHAQAAIRTELRPRAEPVENDP